MDFAGRIIEWYNHNKRDLPWRQTSDPYRIWVSEVILQQTRVEQGLSYYEKFLDRFPDIECLAQASEEEVMKTWQGLGYYSRARNMHQAAREISSKNSGKFPGNYLDIIRLPGIGDYSASAITSIAFHKAYPVIDGNVLRVMARYLGISSPVKKPAVKKQIRQVLADLIDRQQPGNFNQAVMELGALVCIPREPKCDRCPLSEDCHAHNHGMASSLPVLFKQGEKKIHYYFYFVFIAQENGQWVTWLRKRTGKGIWKGLYDFPLLESEKALPPDAIKTLQEFLDLTSKTHMAGDLPRMITDRHILSHRDLRVTFLIHKVLAHSHPEHIRVNFNDLYNYPVPRLIENFLKKLDFDRVYF